VVLASKISTLTPTVVSMPKLKVFVRSHPEVVVLVLDTEMTG